MDPTTIIEIMALEIGDSAIRDNLCIIRDLLKKGDIAGAKDHAWIFYGDSEDRYNRSDPEDYGVIRLTSAIYNIAYNIIDKGAK